MKFEQEEFMGQAYAGGASMERFKWASTLLTTIGSAGIGYMTGKNSK
jgi:hypothetical protein